MSGVEDHLVVVEKQMAVGQRREPEARLRQLIEEIGEEELKVWEADLRRIFDAFTKKPRRELGQLLDERLGRLPRVLPEVKPNKDALNREILQLSRDFQAELLELSNYHIFQWSTFYRDVLSKFFHLFLDIGQRGAALEASAACRQLVGTHAHLVFQKGYAHVFEQRGRPHDEAVAKSLNGLQRFLELPVEFYFASSATAVDAPTGRCLRQLCAAFLGGVLEGYGSARYGRELGWQLLPRYARSWAHYLGFLTRVEIGSVASSLERGDFLDGLRMSVAPFVAALDAISEAATDFTPLPSVGQFSWQSRRLETAFAPPPDSERQQPLEVHCYMREAEVTQQALLDSARRGVALIVAPLRADLRGVVLSHSVLSTLVVEAHAEDSAGVAARVRDRLDLAIFQTRSARAGAIPLTYNCAREFPLRNPFLARYFHVPRSSVRDLLRVFERRNGVRLWCSVRRSGKTTACFDLGTTTGTSSVVSQTCSSTEQYPNSSVFFDQVAAALSSGLAIPKDFFSAAVEQSSTAPLTSDSRVVFVLDEYETLFGRLQAELSREGHLRYTVVQPLLDQMVAFAKDNLLVFMGQHPNAHFILMDQNQLSPYVEQDRFPLFQHTEGTTAGEFAELLRKVLTERIQFDGGFADAVFQETYGHPYLTVNVIVELVDWLIEQKRPSRQLKVHAGDFAGFAEARLTRQRIGLSPEYEFFRKSIAEATTPLGAKQNPWLYAVYSCMQRIASAFPADLSCSRIEFEQIVEALKLSALGLGADEVLRTGDQANFLGFDDHRVWPRIRLLARVSQSVRTSVTK